MEYLVTSQCTSNPNCTVQEILFHASHFPERFVPNRLRFSPPDDSCSFFPAFGPFQNTHELDLRILPKEYYSPLGK